MKPIDVEIMMGHSTGISDSYYRPTEKDYLKATDALIMSQEQKLHHEVEKLRGKAEIDIMKYARMNKFRLNDTVTVLSD